MAQLTEFGRLVYIFLQETAEKLRELATRTEIPAKPAGSTGA